MSSRAWVAAAAGTLAAAALFFWLQVSPVDWSGQRQSTCFSEAHGCFCEADRGGPVRQPANVWSCLGFVFFGLLILGARTQRGADPALDPFFVQAYGWVILILGLTSAWFHASLTFFGEWADGSSMHLLASLLIAHNLRRGGALDRRGFLRFFLALSAVNLVWLAVSPVLRKESFGALLFVVVFAEMWARRRTPPLNGRLFEAALATFAASYGIWLLDAFGKVCSPHSLLQGHAAWHVLDALAAWLLFLYYRSLTKPA